MWFMYISWAVNDHLCVCFFSRVRNRKDQGGCLNLDLNFEYFFAFYQWQITFNLFFGLLSVIEQAIMIMPMGWTINMSTIATAASDLT